MGIIEEYGYSGYDLENITGTGNGIPARIIAVHRERYEIVCDKGYAYGKLKSSVYYDNGNEEYPTVGDFVVINYNESGDSVIIKTLKRKTVFVRKDPASKLHKSSESNKCQYVAANFDYVFIMTSLNNDFNISRIERYLTTVLQSKAIPVIILTKLDIQNNYDSEMKQIMQIASNVNIHAISSKTGEGLGELKPYLKTGNTIAFMGSSGVGKSTLINCLSDEEIMKTNGIRDDDSKGKHTTTHRQLIMLKSGVMLIDTPGMRELGMWDVSEGMDKAFSDIIELFSACRFRNCSHSNEPGCAVLEAIRNGRISISRWEEYKKIEQDSEKNDSKRNREIKGKEIGKKVNKYKKQQKKFNLYGR